MHLITLLELMVVGLFFYFNHISTGILHGNFSTRLLLLMAAIVPPLMAQLDARSRYQNYKLAKDKLQLYGFQPRLIKPLSKSKCQRDAVKAAASELGMLKPCREYFTKMGYKWYHIVPDIIFKRPQALLTSDFWRTTLFARTYHPKINFEKNDFDTPKWLLQ